MSDLFNKAVNLAAMVVMTVGMAIAIKLFGVDADDLEWD